MTRRRTIIDPEAKRHTTQVKLRVTEHTATTLRDVADVHGVSAGDVATVAIESVARWSDDAPDDARTELHAAMAARKAALASVRRPAKPRKKRRVRQ